MRKQSVDFSRQKQKKIGKFVDPQIALQFTPSKEILKMIYNDYGFMEIVFIR